MSESEQRIYNRRIIFLICLFICLASFLIWTVVYKTSVLFSIVLAIWACLLSYSILHIHECITGFCFLVSLFVFLLGRQVCYAFFQVKEVYEFLDKTNELTYLCILVSLIGYSIGSIIGKKKRFRFNYPILSVIQSNSYARACRLMYLICYAFQIVVVLLQIRYVKRVGYLASYTNEDGGSGIPSLLFYPSSFAPIALSFYLATKPTHRETIPYLFLYEIYAILSLLTGQRYPFVGINMFIFSYLLIRNKNEGGWIKRSYCVLLLIALPVIIVFLTAYDTIRAGKAFSFVSLPETIVRFMDQQGGSINTIRRTIYNAKQIRDLKLVSFSSTRTALFENGIARMLFSDKVYSGTVNSIDAALKGHSLASRLSYIAYGNEYLAGRGTGSSYIAELFHDFGVIGVGIGSALYGYWLKRINLMQFQKRVLGGIGLAMLYYLYLSPRGSFDAFVGYLFRLYSVALFCLMLLLAYILDSTTGKAQ